MFCGLSTFWIITAQRKKQRLRQNREDNSAPHPPPEKSGVFIFSRILNRIQWIVVDKSNSTADTTPVRSVV
jgi:hypothetical protein